MAKAPYEGHYQAHRNPNSTMLRVLSNVGFDIRLDYIQPSFTRPSTDSRYKFVSRVHVNVLSKDLIAEAEEANFEFYEATATHNGRLRAKFGVLEEDEDETRKQEA